MKTLLPAVVGAMLALCTVEASADGTAGERQVSIVIESKTLAEALDEWAKQTGYQIVVRDWQLTKKLPAPTLKGSFHPRAALEKLLDGTPLTWALVSDKAVVVREKERSAPAKPAETTGRDDGRHRWRDRSGTQEGIQEEVVVAGTNMREVDSPSPVLVFGREEIAATGVTTLQQFFEKLPQNFGGGANPSNTLRTPQAGNDSFTAGFGAGINIRGLGAGTTLTLVNGHRLAPSDNNAFVDVSMIPLTAIERIEIVSDGASAIYGSDAVGGVVNIILRDRYDGLETGMRYGAVTQGAYHELRVSQAAGTSWEGGRIIATYEHLDQDTLASSAKDFSRNAPFPWDLIPRAKRDGLYGSIAQEFGRRTLLAADFYYWRRSNDFSANAFGFPSREAARVEQYGGVLAGTVELSDSWRLQLSSGYSEDSVSNKSLLTVGDFTLADERSNKTSGWYFDAVADGAVVKLPAGAVRVAVGASRHQERYSANVASTPLADFSDRRDVDALFAEASIPLIGDGNSVPGIELLALTVAIRRDRYSDFGSTTNPKFGAIWQPIASVRARATYSESFRAPTFDELSAQNGSSGLAMLPDPSAPSGQTLTLFADGGNPDLGPETARIWTTGLEWRPDFLPDLATSVTYYDIDYRQRVAAPLEDITALFLQEGAFATLIDRDPTPEEIDRFVNIGGFGFTIFTEAPFGVPPGVDQSSTEVIADLRLHNVASTRQRGLDLQLENVIAAALGQIVLSLNANYILDSTKKLTDASPAQSAVNLIYTPVDLRVRAGVNLQRNALFAALYANYTDKYVNNTVNPSTSIGSWATLDGMIGYKVDGPGRSMFDSLKFQLSVQNLLDRDPPFVSNLRGTGFDPTNAGPLGRFIAIDVTAEW